MNRVYNFSAGPAVLPLEVLEEASRELPNFHGQGMSILEMSHRGATYSAIHEEAGRTSESSSQSLKRTIFCFCRGAVTCSLQWFL